MLAEKPILVCLQQHKLVWWRAGAVGLEALSRGCQECHFIEMDQTVARDSLARNIAECGLTSQATVHAMVCRFSGQNPASIHIMY